MNLYPPQRLEVSSSPYMLGPVCDYSISGELRKENALISKFYDGSLNTREGILELQNILLLDDESLGEDPFPLFHNFSNGLYTREIHIPKGYLIIGKIHRNEHIVHLTKGSLLVADEFGTRKLKAPATFVSKSGVKRVGYIIEDVVWMDIHRTDAKTVKDVEKEIFVDSYEVLMKESKILKAEDYI